MNRWLSDGQQSRGRSIHTGRNSAGRNPNLTTAGVCCSRGSHMSSPAVLDEVLTGVMLFITSFRVLSRCVVV